MLSPPRQHLPSLISAPEFNLDFLWGLSFVFLGLSVLYVAGIFLLRNRIGSLSERSKNKKMEFSPMISEFLFYEDTSDKDEKKNYLNLKVQIREQIKNGFDRNVLTEILLDLRKDLSGQSQDVLTDLYWDLGLHNDAFEKLASRRWQIISKGILELTTMDVVESYGMIVKFINHRNSTIRKQAEIAVVNLREEGIAYFLDNTKYKISEWQQLKLLDVLRHKQNFEPPQFSLWLISNNTHVVLFALRLIKYFNQSDAEQSIVTLLKHRKREIQTEAIECIKEFYFVGALPTLKLVYPKAAMDVKIAVLSAIGEIGTEQEVGFLKTVKAKEKNFMIRSKILGTLNKLCPESVMPFKNIKDDTYFAIKKEEGTLVGEEIDPTLGTTAENRTAAVPIDDPFQTDVVEIEAKAFSEPAFSESPQQVDAESSVSYINLEEIDSTGDTTRFLPPKTLEEVGAFFDFEGSPELERTDKRTTPSLEREIDEIDWSALYARENQKEQEVTKTEVEPPVEVPYDTISFTASFLEDGELETMVLLEQIADMGDRRELPVLYELLTTNSSGLIVERTKELIAKFTYQSPGPNELFNSNYDITDSVFTSIFNLSDLETKKILLKEIKNIGDAKEIPLLEHLIKDDNKRIARLAKVALDSILGKIEDQKSADGNATENKVLRAGFESKLEQHKNSVHNGEGITFFDDLCSASHTLYNNPNG